MCLWRWREGDQNFQRLTLLPEIMIIPLAERPVRLCRISAKKKKKKFTYCSKLIYAESAVCLPINKIDYSSSPML